MEEKDTYNIGQLMFNFNPPVEGETSQPQQQTTQFVEHYRPRPEAYYPPRTQPAYGYGYSHPPPPQQAYGGYGYPPPPHESAYYSGCPPHQGRLSGRPVRKVVAWVVAAGEVYHRFRNRRHGRLGYGYGYVARGGNASSSDNDEA